MNWILLLGLQLLVDDINVHSEELVYEALLTWLDCDPKRQDNHLVDLFGLIRLPLIERKV